MQEVRKILARMNVFRLVLGEEKVVRVEMRARNIGRMDAASPLCSIVRPILPNF